MTANTSTVDSLVRSVSGLVAFDKANIEALAGAPLQAGDEDPDLVQYSADLPQGPFSRVELRVPAQQRDHAWRLVIAYVRPGTRLSFAELRGELIPADSAVSINPRVPPDGTVTYAVEQPGLSTRYQFGARSSCLQLIAFHQEVRHVGKNSVSGAGFGLDVHGLRG